MSEHHDQEPVEKSPTDLLLEDWSGLYAEEKIARFRSLSNDDAEEIILALPSREQAAVVKEMSRAERRLWMRFLPPDDATDVIQALPDEIRAEVLSLVDETARREITALLSYLEDEAGGLMSPRFARVRPDMLVAEAIRYVRQQARVVDPVHYVYVLDANQRLLGVLSLRALFVSIAREHLQA
ncbi:MAG: CBS domain-containing protein [Bdellovibrionota bacterium]